MLLPYLKWVMGFAEEAGAEEYCDRLEHQNDGELATTVITYVGLLFGYTSLSLGVVLATMCCTCWCCCARPGWCDCIATRASVNCYMCWGDCLHTFGCSWCVHLRHSTLILRVYSALCCLIPAY